MRSRKIKLVLILFLSLTIIPGLCLGATYYVDANNGNDSNSGASDAPWATFQRALPDYSGEGDVVLQGDIVYVASGDYGKIYYKEDGDAGRSDYIVYRGAPGKTSIFRQIQIYNTQNTYIQFHGFTIYPPDDVHNGRNDNASIFLKHSPAGDGKYIENVGIYNCTIIGAEYPGRYNSAQAQPGHYQCINMNDAENIIIDGCTFQGGAYGIGMGGYNKNIRITNCSFTDQWNDIIAIRPGAYAANNITIEDCIFDRLMVTNSTHLSSHLDYVQTATTVNHMTMRNNIFHGTWDTAWLNLPDQALAYSIGMLQHSGEGFIFENNLLYGRTAGTGWRLTGTVSDVKIINNSFVYVSDDVTQGTGIGSLLTNVRHFNNIYHDRTSVTTNSSKITQGNNIYSYYMKQGGGKTGPIMDESSTIIDVGAVKDLFIDFNNNDFSLAENSLAIDFGNPLNTTLSDITGNYRDASPDAGCYEYGSSGNGPLEPEADGDIAVERTQLATFNNVIKTGGNTQAIIRCDTTEAGELSVIIYDSKGKEIKVLFDGNKEAGRYEFTWSASDVGSGIYMVNMVSGGYSETKKVAVIK